MEELESQIAKINLGNSKTSTSYVYVMAEKAPVGQTELYVVAEMPLFNPAAEDSCERICLAIASALKRSYKKPFASDSFENAVSQINEELGKLASLGQTQWIDKLNCILGVKNGNEFSVASCGKVSAFLLRNKEYTDISCSPAQSHPLKTFENFATGKIRVGDLLILSTTQMFNYLAMDRLLQIVSSVDFLTATKTIIELLKNNSDPQVSFGVLLNLQVPPGQTREVEEDLENYVVEKPVLKKNIFVKIFEYVKMAFGLEKKPSRLPGVGLPKISLRQKLKNFGGNTKNFLAKGRGWLNLAKTSAKSVNVQTFKGLSPQKKFFFISALILALAVVINIGLAVRLKNTSQLRIQIKTQLQDAQTLLGKTQASLLYKDNNSAVKFLADAKTKIPSQSSVDSSNRELYNKVLATLTDVENQIEGVFQPQVANLGSLGPAGYLIKLPNYLGAQINQAIVSYNKQNGKIEDSALKLGIISIASAYVSGNSAAIFDGKALYLWDFSAGSLGSGFTQNVPGASDFAGIAEYPTNGRVYLVDKKAQAVISFLPSKNNFSKPVVAVRDPILNQALDLAIGIDGSIYVLTQKGISKFQNGRSVEFAFPNLSVLFSGNGKIYTQKDFKFLYLLDAGSNRVMILDKKGNLFNTLKSPSFTKLKDLQVDEAGKTMYLLNDSSLLKVTLP